MIKDNEIYNTILKRRSIRRFKQKPISNDVLKKLVNVARLAPSAANLQPLEFYIVNDKNLCSKVFETLSWAGYIKSEWTPGENERPMAYIVIIVKDNKNTWYLRDASYAAANIVIAAEGMDIGSCILCKIDRDKLREYLKVPDNVFLIDSVIALGYKAEQPVVEDIADSVKYYKDEKQVLHVPKRKLEDILHINKY
jgi:nitroreductase